MGKFFLKSLALHRKSLYFQTSEAKFSLAACKCITQNSQLTKITLSTVSISKIAMLTKSQREDVASEQPILSKLPSRKCRWSRNQNPQQFILKPQEIRQGSFKTFEIPLTFPVEILFEASPSTCIASCAGVTYKSISHFVNRRHRLVNTQQKSFQNASGPLTNKTLFVSLIMLNHIYLWILRT